MNDVSLNKTAVVEALSTDGRGVVRVADRAYFVAGGLPGDRLRLQLDAHTHPPSAILLEVLENSPNRVTHPCAHCAECVGSPWGALAYPEQLKHKRQLVERTLRKMIGDVAVLPMIPSPQEWRYRNRISLHLWQSENRIAAGFQTAARQSGGTAIQECRLASPMIAVGIAALVSTLASIRVSSELVVPHRLQLHETAAGAGGLLVFAGDASRKAVKTWEAILHRDILPGGVWFASGTRAGVPDYRQPVHPSEGALPLQTMSLGHAIELEPTAFCQANREAAELVETRIRDWIQPYKSERVWDLYGGYGALGLAVAGSERPLTVFEISTESEPALKKLSAAVGNTSARFVPGDLLRTFRESASEIGPRDVILLDPPRSGAHGDVLNIINHSTAKAVIYLSCNPARLARDLALLKTGGFVPESIEPCDFFPQTPAIETLVFLTRE